MTSSKSIPDPGRLALWGVKRPNEQPVIPYLNEQTARYNCGPSEQVMHRRSPSHPWEPVAYEPVQAAPLPRTVVLPAPPDAPGDDLEEEIAGMLIAIEANYRREGSGYGSRFEGQRLEIAQARAVIRRIREAAS